MKAKFDYSLCRECPHQADCPAGKNKGKYYFNHSDYNKQKRHNSMKELSEKERNIRSGCERTMFEMFNDRKHGKKVRFRGRFRIELNTFFRAIGTNFSRIFRYNSEKPEKTEDPTINGLLFVIIYIFKKGFQLLTGFRELKIRKFFSSRPFSYNVPNLKKNLS